MARPYALPATSPPPVFKEAKGWMAAAPADATPRGAWWTTFESRDLDALEAHVAPANQSLAAAVARYDQARATARLSRADLYPTISGDASEAHRQNSSEVANVQARRRSDDTRAGLDLVTS